MKRIVKLWFLTGLSLSLLFGSAVAEPTPFTNFLTFNITEGLTGIGRHIDAPFQWYEGEIHETLPGMDANSRHDWIGNFGAFAPTGEDPLVIQAPITVVSMISDFDDDGNLIGTLSLAGTGTIDTDLNIEAALVDDMWSSQVYTPYRIVENFEITGQTGSFVGLEQVGEWSLIVQGRTGRPVFKDGDIASSTTNLGIGATSTYFMEGMYDWDLSAEPTSPSVIPLDCNLDGTVSVEDLNCAEAIGIESALTAADLTHGDINGDGTVDFPDFLTLSNNFSNEGSYTDGDLDLDGTVDFPDFLILAANYQATGELAAVPEPSAGPISVAFALALLGVVRRRR